MMAVGVLVACKEVTTDPREETLGTEGLDYYPLSGGTYGVSAGKTIYLEEVFIPATYKGKAVTEVLPSAFQNSQNLKSITIPGSVTSIGMRRSGVAVA